MSDRTWLGVGIQDWADWNLCTYPSMEDLCKAAAWKLPAKVWSPDIETLNKFLNIIARQHYMYPKDFSVIGLQDQYGQRRCLTEEEMNGIKIVDNET